jgi:glycine/D-amino acid oxidase-like deaminating enzyme
MRGQMVAYRSVALHHVVWGEEGYLVPKQNGFLFAGATVENVGFRANATREGVRQMKAMAGRLVPALRGSDTASEWAGLRPGSPDGLPILGALPATENVYIATGHFRSGILLAPITGKLMSERIVRGPASVSLDPFSPARFVVE